MRIMNPQAIACCVITILITRVATAATADSCLGGKKQTLINGHFTGLIVCSPKDASFRLVGMTNGYAVYDYRYRFLPFEGAPVMHGGQRLLVFHDGKYIGQYSMSPPPETTVMVRGSFLLLSKPGADSVRVDFSTGPPSSIFFDGETEDLYR